MVVRNDVFDYMTYTNRRETCVESWGPDGWWKSVLCRLEEVKDKITHHMCKRRKLHSVDENTDF
jgi:hypothetical protein